MSPPYAFDEVGTAAIAVDYEGSRREAAGEVSNENYTRDEGEESARIKIHREVLGYTPRRGDESSTFWATVRYEGDASPKITQLKLGFGSFIVPDTKCTSTQSSDDPSASKMMLMCRVPAFVWVGWFMRKVPVYVLVIDEDHKEKQSTVTTADVEIGKKRKQETEFVVVDSWFIGDFMYNDDDRIVPVPSRFVRPKMPVAIANPGPDSQDIPQLHTQQELITPSKQPIPQLHPLQDTSYGVTSRESPIFAPSRQPAENLSDLADDVAFTEETTDQNPITSSSTSLNMLTSTSTPISDRFARPGSQSSHMDPRDLAYGTQLLYGHDVPPPRNIGFSPPQTPGTKFIKQSSRPSSCSSSSFSSSSSISGRLRKPSLTNSGCFAGLITPSMSPVNPYYISTSMASTASAQRGSKKERQRGHTTNAESFLGTTALLKWETNFSLDEMVRNWSEDENIIRRRLVQFTRRQEHNVIHCGYGHFNSDSVRSENTFVVSCIYWPEPLTENRPEYYSTCESRISPLPSPTSLSPSPVYGSRPNGHQPHGGPTHFITSVDLIHLLEFLLDCIFTIDEKNRIRRNLEVFKPLTVSKRKTETRELFAAIMKFPNPKPRNIEKGLKIYDWFDVKNSLEKITSRYSATFSVSSFNSQHRLGPQYRGDGEDFMSDEGRLNELQTLSQSPLNHAADHRLQSFTPTSASNSPMFEYRSESLPDVRHLHFRKHFGEEDGSSSSSSISTSCTMNSSLSAATLTAACLPRISSDPVFDGFGSEQIVRPKPQRPRITTVPTTSFSSHADF